MKTSLSDRGRLLIEAFESAVKHKVGLAERPRDDRSWAEEHYQNRLAGLREYIAKLESKD